MDDCSNCGGPAMWPMCHGCMKKIDGSILLLLEIKKAAEEFCLLDNMHQQTSHVKALRAALDTFAESIE